jgi:hypothetical protein
MAALGGMPLALEKMSGASFKLATKARESWVHALGDGSEIEIKAGSEVVVVRIPTVGSYDLAFGQALVACQKGLDMIAMTRGEILSVGGFQESHFAWWQDPSGPTIRLVGFARMTMEALPATVVGGTAPPPPAWDPCFRYYRLSQMTDDLVDAYRNMFLMRESLLSEFGPRRREREKTVGWLPRCRRLTTPPRRPPFSKLCVSEFLPPHVLQCV